MPPLPKPVLMLDILEEHFEELDFLWDQREAAVFSPDWTLRDLAEHEERAEAHLDGLRVGQGHSVDLARSFLTGEEKSAVTAAALTMMAFGDPDLEAEVVAALLTASPDARDGIRIALRHSDITRVVPHLRQLAASADTSIRVAALDLLAFHRQPPPAGLPELLFKCTPESRALLYGALGRFGGPWSTDPLQIAFDGGTPELQRSALETSARLGVPDLASMCRRAAGRPENPPGAALAFLGVLGDPQDLPLFQNSLGRKPLALAALAGLGALGRTEAIPALIEAMTDKDLTQAAGAAFTRITGANDIRADKPLPPPEGLSEEELEFFDPIFPADPAKARAWWEREKGRFTGEGRWQAGREVSKEPLGAAFQRLPLETRRDVYLGFRARSGSQAPDLEFEKRARLQMGIGPAV